MKITEDVRRYAEEKGLSGDDALKVGLEEKPGNSRTKATKSIRLPKLVAAEVTKRTATHFGQEIRSSPACCPSQNVY
jgi:hypothetical protein